MDLEITWGGKKETHRLGDGEHTVGRAGDNTIKILSGRVSKHHAVVRIEGERLLVRDLGSTNGTEVNGRRVGGEEVEVPHGGTVSFGGAALCRLGVRSAETVALSRDQDVSTLVRYNLREGFSTAARDRIMEISSGLFELLASDRDAAEIGRAACQFVAKVVHADRVVLLEDEGEATSVEPRASWSRSGDDGAPLRLSSTLVAQVLRERDSVLVPNPMEDPKYTGRESIVALHLRSAMAVPLFDNERVRGILYVDTANPRVRYSGDDLQVLTATANAVAVKLRNLTLEGELRTAARIQRSMLPRKLRAPEGYDVDAYQLMCRAVGGDLYHCSERSGGGILLALGDVAGKGMPAALAMGAATVLIGMLSEIDQEIETLVRHLHRQLHRSFGEGQFLTLFLGELDPSTGTLRYLNAGHEPPVVVRADGRVERLDSTGLPVAMLDDLMLESAEMVVGPGDLVAVFSDGIPEATTNGETFLGLDSVLGILAGSRGRSLPDIRKDIVAAVETFLAGGHVSDDVTLLLVRRKPS